MWLKSVMVAQMTHACEPPSLLHYEAIPESIVSHDAANDLLTWSVQPWKAQAVSLMA